MPASLPTIVIPAYQPGPALPNLIRDLRARQPRLPIVVVDDGSSPECAAHFEQAASFPGVEMLRHAVNLGKGQALKTAFNHVLLTRPDGPGVVTADADGQHHFENVLALAERLAADPATFLLGVRTFSDDVPFRSRIGNKITRTLFKLLVGRGISDTQTGLRAIPTAMLGDLLSIAATGYDFELEMLIRAVRQNRPLAEHTIQTLYIDDNSSSHFRPLFDSLRIYFVFLRFSTLALTTAGLDFLVFSLAFLFSDSILTSIIIARIVAGSYNFIFGKLLVFRSRNRMLPEALKYGLTVLVLMLISYTLIDYMVVFWGMNVIVSKAIIETTLFLVSFSVLNTFVFKRCN